MNDDMGHRSSSRAVEPEVCVAIVLRLLSRASYHDLMMIFGLLLSTTAFDAQLMF